MRPGFVGSYGLGPGRPAMRADTRENPVGKNGVMTPGLDDSLLLPYKNRSECLGCSPQ
jgi:hypothetical protein